MWKTKKIEDIDMEKSEDMKERIEHILRAQNLTAAEFAEKLGIQASGMSHILSGRNNPSLDFVMKLKAAFPEYNFDWLLLGVGPMTSYEQPTLFVEHRDEAEDYNNKVSAPQPAEVVTESLPEPMPQQSEKAENELEMIIFVYSDGTFEQKRPRKA
jgi:transcriptional regulator with XRE-family HTH domain